MKVPLLLAFAGLALALVVPTFVQQNTVDPEVRHQIEAAMTKQEEAYNKYDAAAFAAGFMQQAIEFSPGGVAWSRQEIEQRYVPELAAHAAKLVQVYAIGSDICAI